MLSHDPFGPDAYTGLYNSEHYYRALAEGRRDVDVWGNRRFIVRSDPRFRIEQEAERLSKNAPSLSTFRADYADYKRRKDAELGDLSIYGRAVVSQPELQRLMKAVVKLLPSRAARRSTSVMRANTFDSLCDAVRLTFAPRLGRTTGFVSAEVHTIADGAAGWVSIPFRVSMRLEQSAPFSVVVSASTLKDLLNVLDKDMPLTLEHRALIDRLVVRQGRSTSRIVTPNPTYTLWR